MYYSGFDGDNWRIYKATSEDSYSWEKKGMVLDLGEKDEKDNTFVDNPFVMRDKVVACDGSEVDTFYHMWYSGFDGDNWRIFHAISADGTTWDKTGVAIDLGGKDDKDNTFVQGATVVLDIEKQRVQYCCVEVSRVYHMYYGGFDGDNWRIFHAFSPDGNTWIKTGVVVDLGNNSIGNLDQGLNETTSDTENLGDSTDVRNPSAVLVKKYSDCKTTEKKFHLWYTGFNGDNERVFKAESNDGFMFRKIDDKVENR